MGKTIHRLVQLITALNLSARQFDLAIGSGNGYTLRMQKNNASVGSDVIERIKEKFPQVNLEWLITGKGDMFIKPQTQKKRSEEEIKDYIEKRLQKEINADKKALLDEIIKEIEKLEQTTNL